MYFIKRCLLVALEFECGWIACSVAHALVLVNKKTVFLDGDVFLQRHAAGLRGRHRNQAGFTRGKSRTEFPGS